MTPVIIPVNHLDRAKGRLADVLTPEERAGLALATLRTVVGAVRGAGFEATLLTPEPERLTPEFEGPGVTVRREDPHARGLNAQLEAALAGRDEALVLHADLPLATAEAIARLLGTAPSAPSTTLLRSPDGGTNAMLLRPPGRFSLAYGRGSFAKHHHAALAAGLQVSVAAEPTLALDLDTASDLAALLATDAGRASAAGQLLIAAGVGRRLAAVQES